MHMISQPHLANIHLLKACSLTQRNTRGICPERRLCPYAPSYDVGASACRNLSNSDTPSLGCTRNPVSTIQEHASTTAGVRPQNTYTPKEPKLGGSRLPTRAEQTPVDPSSSRQSPSYGAASHPQPRAPLGCLKYRIESKTTPSHTRPSPK